MESLFSSYEIRGLTLRNRVVMSPMCQYSCDDQDGKATDWHVVHMATRAAGGVGLAIMEATAVEPGGRISYECTGLWTDDQIEPFARVVKATKDQGAAIGIQLAHAGRKAATEMQGNWDDGQRLVGPSPVPFDDGWVVPSELDHQEIENIVGNFADAARRAVSAGFDMVEIHAAHGYLLSSFLSPLANLRTDAYGGSIANRARFAVDVVLAVREVVPQNMPVFVRISGVDFVDNGTKIEDSIEVSKLLAKAGADVIDVSGGGNSASVPPVRVGAPGYQVDHADQIRRKGGVSTMAVGMITKPAEADAVIRDGSADLVALGRELLRNPYWALHAADELGCDIEWPKQYMRAR